MQIALGPVRVQLDIDDAFQPAPQLRALVNVLAAKFPQAAVHALQQRAIFSNELRQVDAADFFFALDDEFDFNGSGPTAERYARKTGCGLIRLPLLSATPRAKTLPSRMAAPRGRSPKLKRLGRLHVIVVVDHQWCAGRCQFRRRRWARHRLPGSAARFAPSCCSRVSTLVAISRFPDFARPRWAGDKNLAARPRIARGLLRCTLEFVHGFLLCVLPHARL